MPNLARGVDLALGTKVLLEGDAQRVAADTQRFFSRKRIQTEAMRGERERVGREVHDGALQALTAVSLQLEILSRLIESDPSAARRLVGSLRHVVGDEQRKLRTWLAHQDAHMQGKVTFKQLAASVQTLCARAESQWRLRVDFRHVGQRDAAADLADHVYRIVQESLTNVGKHARAATARVQIESRVASIDVVVADDGVGLALRGRHDLASLQRRHAGPRSLMQRVAMLGGEMWLTSHASGTVLEFSLPVAQPAGNREYDSA